MQSQASRLYELMQRLLSEQQSVISNLDNRIKRQDPVIRIRNEKDIIEGLKNRLNSTSVHVLQLKKANLGQLSGKLNALSPLATLERGYALVQVKDDKLNKIVVTSVSNVQEGQTISSKLKDGDIESTVTKIKNN